MFERTLVDGQKCYLSGPTGLVFSTVRVFILRIVFGFSTLGSDFVQLHVTNVVGGPNSLSHQCSSEPRRGLRC